MVETLCKLLMGWGGEAHSNNSCSSYGTVLCMEGEQDRQALFSWSLNDGTPQESGDR
jgi:hypothetical protein